MSNNKVQPEPQDVESQPRATKTHTAMLELIEGIHDPVWKAAAKMLLAEHGIEEAEKRIKERWVGFCKVAQSHELWDLCHTESQHAPGGAAVEASMSALAFSSRAPPVCDARRRGRVPAPRHATPAHHGM